MRTFNVKNHGEIQTPHSDAEIYNRLARYHHGGLLKSDFAYNYGGTLLMKRRQYGRWFDNQLAWAVYFVWQVENPLLDQAKRQGSTVTGLGSIVEHMEQCRARRDAGGAGLKNPQVRIKLNGVQFTLKLAGPNSRNRGCVSVAESHLFGEGDFYGWIQPNGEFKPRSVCSQGVIDLLQRIAQDPPTQINEIGKEAGMCCYCWSALSQVQSKIAGCGRTCARNYGVDYPNAAETREFVAQHPEVLTGSSDADRWVDSAGPLASATPVPSDPWSPEEDDLEDYLFQLRMSEDS
jgi:hypothetical protein